MKVFEPEVSTSRVSLKVRAQLSALSVVQVSVVVL